MYRRRDKGGDLERERVEGGVSEVRRVKLELRSCRLEGGDDRVVAKRKEG